MRTIDKFDGQYAFLSNFYSCKIAWNGVIFDSVETAFQASKSTNKKEFESFAGLTPNLAKKKGRHITLRTDWEDIKYSVMNELVHQKFFNHPDLALALLTTQDATLIEGNYWHDTYWGVCNGKGENNLGKILMQTREDLRNKHSMQPITQED